MSDWRVPGYTSTGSLRPEALFGAATPGDDAGLPARLARAAGCRVWDAEGREYLVDYTLHELETRLPQERFVRVHRGALVNLDAVESYGGEEGVLVLKLKDGTRVEASERRAAEVRRRLR